MALDIKKLREMQKQINSKAGQGDGILFFSNKLTEEGIDIRLLPPKENMNGVYFLEQTGWWVNGKFYPVDPDNDVIEEEIEEAKASKERDLIALVEKKNNGMSVLKKETRYLLPILILKAVYNDDEELVSVKVEETRVLVAKATVLMEINKIVTSKQYQNGTKDGIADRVKGWNITLMKEGKGLDTKYHAIGWTERTEIDEKWYEDKNVPDLIKIDNDMRKSEEVTRSVIRNYLYGEPLLEEGEDNEEEEETPAPKKKSKSPAKPTPSKKHHKEEEEDDDEEWEDEEEEAPKKKAKKPAAPAKKKSVLSDMEDEDEDDEEEEEDEPAPATKKKTKPAGAPKKRSLLDDALSDMEDMD